jgi:hypothetical protein
VEVPTRRGRRSWNLGLAGVFLLGAFAAGCARSPPALDGGDEGQVRGDGGLRVEPEGGALLDGGPQGDAGTFRDGGSGSDGGTTIDAGSTAADGSVASDGGLAGCVSGLSDLHLRLDTTGGFWGDGDYDYVATRQAITIVDKHRQRQCSSVLSATQAGNLLGAAAAVDWGLIRSSYIPADNPSCCCDQLAYELHVELTPCDGATRSAQTSWCEEATHDGTLPDSLFQLLRALLNIARDVLTAC